MSLNDPTSHPSVPPSFPACIGLIAGNGDLPLIFAREVKGRLGIRLVAAAHRRETNPELASLVDDLRWFHLGQFGKILRFLGSSGADQVVMAGGIVKSRIWDVRPDALALKLAMRLGTLDDDTLLRGVAGLLEEAGIRVRAPTDFVADLYAREGNLTRRSPTPAQWEELRHAWRAAKELGRLDIGQGVVVKQRAVVAVEAMEGTDAMIQRAGSLTCGGGVMVKVSKPQQDRRLDMPTIGPRTMESLSRAGIEVLAIEAGSTIILDPQVTLGAADRLGLVVVALRDGEPPLVDGAFQDLAAREGEGVP